MDRSQVFWEDEKLHDLFQSSQVVRSQTCGTLIWSILFLSLSVYGAISLIINPRGSPLTFWGVILLDGPMSYILAWAMVVIFLGCAGYGFWSYLRPLPEYAHLNTRQKAILGLRGKATERRDGDERSEQDGRADLTRQGETSGSKDNKGRGSWPLRRRPPYTPTSGAYRGSPGSGSKIAGWGSPATPSTGRVVASPAPLPPFHSPGRMRQFDRNHVDEAELEAYFKKGERQMEEGSHYSTQPTQPSFDKSFQYSPHQQIFLEQQQRVPISPFSGGPQYAASYRPPNRDKTGSSGGAKNDAQCARAYDELIRELNVESEISDQAEKMRQWLAENVIEPLVKDMNKVSRWVENVAAAALKQQEGLMGGSKVIELLKSRDPSQFNNKLRELENLLNKHGGQVTRELQQVRAEYQRQSNVLQVPGYQSESYCRVRVQELARERCLGDFNWNGGGRQWTPLLPTDAQLVMRCFCCHMDKFIHGFSDRYFKIMQSDPKDSKFSGSICIFQARAHPEDPYFLLKHKDKDEADCRAKTWYPPPGRTNFFVALTLFVTFISRKTKGQVQNEFKVSLEEIGEMDRILDVDYCGY